MRSLREAQCAFADALCGPPGAVSEYPAERLDVYRGNRLASYRNALSATYPVVCRLTGAAFFAAAVDAYAAAHPSRSGDLNVYGDAFGEFLEAYPPASGLPYLADVARLEWAIDEAHRAAEAPHVPEAVLAALAIVAADRVSELRLRLDPSCRIVESPYPVLQIWRANQPREDGRAPVMLDEGPDTLLVQRDASGVRVESVSRGEHAWLRELAAHASLGAAIERARQADASFDLGVALQQRITAGTIIGVVHA